MSQLNFALTLEDLQNLWGGRIQKMDPLQIGAVVNLFEGGGSLVGYAPDMPELREIYRALTEKYDRVYNGWKFR